MLYEALLLIGVLGVMIIPLALFSATTSHTPPIPALRVYIFLGLALYFIWHWHAKRQTLAMRTWHLRIVTTAGSHPTLARLAWRYVLAWPSIGLAGVGIVWALFDREGQFLHDRLAKTRIIFVPPTTTSSPPPAGT
jgi:uncharacterized RDD family membrane protein YckC